MAALDTNVLLRLLMRDDLEQLASAQRLINERLAAGETLFVPVSVALELERVHRSRFELDKAAVLRLFSQLLSPLGLRTGTATRWTMSNAACAKRAPSLRRAREQRVRCCVLDRSESEY